VPDALTNAGGTLVLDVADLARRGDRPEARADLKWANAAFPAPLTGARIALGDVRVAVAGSGSEIPATLSNSGGEVDVAGTLVFSTRGTPRIDARIKPRAGLPADRSEAIAAALSSIGRADGAGSYRIVWPLTAMTRRREHRWRTRAAIDGEACRAGASRGACGVAHRRDRRPARRSGLCLMIVYHFRLTSIGSASYAPTSTTIRSGWVFAA
jgi:hypothetical protein